MRSKRSRSGAMEGSTRSCRSRWKNEIQLEKRSSHGMSASRKKRAARRRGCRGPPTGGSQAVAVRPKRKTIRGTRAAREAEVAGEELIAPVAVEGHRHVPPRELREDVGRDARRVSKGAVVDVD